MGSAATVNDPPHLLVRIDARSLGDRAQTVTVVIGSTDSVVHPITGREELRRALLDGCEMRRLPTNEGHAADAPESRHGRCVRQGLRLSAAASAYGMSHRNVDWPVTVMPT
jgi:hypothetical protein